MKFPDVLYDAELPDNKPIKQSSGGKDYKKGKGLFNIMSKNK